MIYTGSREQFIVCTGGERDLATGTVFHMDGDRQLLKVLDVGGRDLGGCCGECYFQLLCRKLQGKVHQIIPHCSRSEREDEEHVYFVPVEPVYRTKCNLENIEKW